MEIWKDIPGYEGFYQASNDGKVRSLNYNHTREKKIMKQSTDKLGYKRVMLCKNGKRKTFQVHRLVAIIFIPNPKNLPCVNHKDENPSNNHINNLEWCSYSYNNNYGTRNERASKAIKGKKHTEETKQKISERKKKRIQCLNNKMIFNSLKEACIWCNLKGNGSILLQIKGERKTAGKDPVTGEKLQWKYID